MCCCLFLQSGYDLAPPYSDYTRVCDVVGGSDAGGGGGVAAAGGGDLVVCWLTTMVAVTSQMFLFSSKY